MSSIRRASMAAVLVASSAASGNLVAIGDEWTFSFDPFTTFPSDTARLARNVAAFATGVNGGTRLGIFSPGPIAYGPQFEAEMVAAGYSVTRFTAPTGITAATLTAFDAVFLTGQFVTDATSIAALTDYINAGGGVVVSAGTGFYGSAAAEAAAWNPLLNTFGLGFGDQWYPVNSTQTVSLLPNTGLVDGVSTIRWGFGHDAFELDPTDPRTDAYFADFTPFGIDQPIRSVIATYRVPAPGAAGLVAATLITAARRRR